MSGLFLCVAFYLYMQQAQQGDSTSPGAFLAAQQQGQPSQEKKDQWSFESLKIIVYT